MSIAQRLAAEAEKRDVDVDLAMKLLDYFKAKSQARGHIEVPDVRDPAHPVHNQANTCWRRFNNYLTCLNENDGDVSACKKASYLAKASCPISWLAEWREQREEGRFAGVQAPVEDEDEE